MSKDTPTSDSIPFTTEHSIEPDLIIRLFEEELQDTLASEDLQENIQLVKGFLYNRDYLNAFDDDTKRFAYVTRWTPMRALSYSSLFGSLEPLTERFQDPEAKTKILCIGGGAASELVGLASVFCRLKEYYPKSESLVFIDIVDIADWGNLVSKIGDYIKNHWIYDSSKLNYNFLCGDILSIERPTPEYSTYDFITLMFTTNELFAEKRTETVKFLKNLNDKCRSGCYLLIAESAGSYSHITIGKKKFPVQFLINTILCGEPGKNNGTWEIVKLSESCWYRIDQKQIKYSMKLENMRFFYYLLKKK